MPRRGENIRKRKDGRWEARCIAGRTPEGEAIYQSVYGRSYAEAKEKKRAFQPDKEPKKTVVVFSLQGVPADMLCREWLDDVIGIKSSSYGTYYELIETHILPYFQNTGTNQLDCDAVNDFIRDKCERGRIDETGGLSDKYVRDMALLLLQIISYGERKGYIKGFDYASVQLPKTKNSEKPVLSSTEHDRLVAYALANIDADTVGILLALFTGIRLGELSALTWKSLDLETGVLYVRKTLQRIKNADRNATSKTRIIIDTPKSACSLRSIPLPDFLLQILKPMKGSQEPDWYVLSGMWKYVEPRAFQKRYKRTMELAGVAYVNFHTLRHTFATRAIERGFDVKNLSEILGHSSVRFTLDTYVHGSIEQKKQCIEKMAVGY